MIEYAPSFEEKYGDELTDSPNTVSGAVTRNDIYIVQNDKLVAQFVNYYAVRDFGGRTVDACTISFPERYSRELPVNRE